MSGGARRAGSGEAARERDAGARPPPPGSRHHGVGRSPTGRAAAKPRGSATEERAPFHRRGVVTMGSGGARRQGSGEARERRRSAPPSTVGVVTMGSGGARRPGSGEAARERDAGARPLPPSGSRHHGVGRSPTGRQRRSREGARRRSAPPSTGESSPWGRAEPDGPGSGEAARERDAGARPLPPSGSRHHGVGRSPTGRAAAKPRGSATQERAPAITRSSTRWSGSSHSSSSGFTSNAW